VIAILPSYGADEILNRCSSGPYGPGTSILIDCPAIQLIGSWGTKVKVYAPPISGAADSNVSSMTLLCTMQGPCGRAPGWGPTWQSRQTDNQNACGGGWGRRLGRRGWCAGRRWRRRQRGGRLRCLGRCWPPGSVRPAYGLGRWPMAPVAYRRRVGRCDTGDLAVARCLIALTWPMDHTQQVAHATPEERKHRHSTE
jgi:hypothetical protein